MEKVTKTNTHSARSPFTIKLTFHTILLLNLQRPIDRLLVAVIPYRHIRPGLRQRLRNHQTDPRAGARDDGGLALVVEEREDFCFFGGRGVVVAECAVVRVDGGLGLAAHG